MVTLWSYNSGVPNLQAMDWSSRRWVAGKRAELHLYLQPLSIACISPQFMEKLSSMKPIPGAKKVGTSAIILWHNAANRSSSHYNIQYIHTDPSL